MVNKKFASLCVSVPKNNILIDCPRFDVGVSWNSDDVAYDEYGRYSNITARNLAVKLLSLYGFDYDNDLPLTSKKYSARLFSSGMQALAMVLYLFESKDKSEINQVVISKDFYHEFREYAAELRGWECSFVDISDMSELEANITPNTKLVFLDSMPLPSAYRPDIAYISKTVHRLNSSTMIVVDNTTLSSYYCNPFIFGADIVVESLCKYVGGHGDAMGGLLVLPSIVEHSSAFRDINLIGCQIDAFSAYLINRGLSTFSLRMDYITASAIRIYDFLLGKGIKDISYGGSGGVICFVLDTKEECKRFISKLDVFTHGYTFGTDKSMYDCVIALDIEGKWRHYVRLSVGLEDTDDLIADLSNALGEIL